MRTIRAALEGLRSPRSPLANRAERGAGSTREFLLSQADLEPGRRHERAIDLDGVLPRPFTGPPSAWAGASSIRATRPSKSVFFIGLAPVLRAGWRQ